MLLVLVLVGVRSTLQQQVLSLPQAAAAAA
jgi:hypothetical protein